MKQPFKRTAKQTEAIRLFGSIARHILLFGGSRSGKTFITVLAIVMRALKAPESRHVIIRKHFKDVRQSIGMDTFPKVMELRFPKVRFQIQKSDWYIKLSNGSEIWLSGLDSKERADKILGKEFATIYFNESSELDYDSIQTALTRLAQKTELINKVYYDCNPPGKTHWSYKLFIEKINPLENTPLVNPDNYTSMLMNPLDNADNLPDGYIDDTLGNLSRLQRQRFLEGRWMDDIEGALWKRAMINPFRIVNAPQLQRIVIGVDPAVTANEFSDMTGIVAAGVDAKGEFYILSDESIKGSPLEWAEMVCSEYEMRRADRVIAEVNNGGDLVISNLKRIAPNLSCKAVRATRGKITRAEPIAALYEQGKVHHVGEFTELEDQMCSYNPATATESPDRMDALVWALTELSQSAGGMRAILA